MDLEKELHRLSKMGPSATLRRQMKGRLMHRIQIHENESWFLKWARKLKLVQPSQRWVTSARMRLMHRISAPQQVMGLMAWAKRVVASAMVMVLAVTTVSLSLGTKQAVVAADSTYLDIHSGYAEVKHADHLEWSRVTEKTNLSVGDLIRLGDTSLATIHFFDDSQLRLSENSLLLISRIENSSEFTHQGLIETALHKGRAWVQTLNVDDKQAHLSISTPAAIVSATNASFDVSTKLFEDTTVRVFKRYVDVQVLSAKTRDIITKGRLNTSQVLTLDGDYEAQPVQWAAIASPTDLSDADRDEQWVKNNLQSDRRHLASLKEREWIRMQAATGALPGDLFYPVKRAKERLSLALSFSQNSATEAQINMADQRLTESLVLIQQGKTDEAKKSLAEYEELVEKITAKNSNKVAKRKFSHQIVASHQKNLLAALPSDAHVNLVKQALDKTEELLAENPLERANVRLQNALDNLAHVQEFVANGDLTAAQDTLVSHDVTTFDVLSIVDQLEDVEVKKELYTKVLETQYAQQRLLDEISKSVEKSDHQLLAKLVENTNQKLATGIQSTIEVVKPVLPDVALSPNSPLPKDDKVQNFVDKVQIYQTRRGQTNQITRLLSANSAQARDLDFLISVRDRLEGQSRELIEFRIEQLRADLAAQKSRKVKAKIDRSKRLVK